MKSRVLCHTFLLERKKQWNSCESISQTSSSPGFVGEQGIWIGLWLEEIDMNG